MQTYAIGDAERATRIEETGERLVEIPSELWQEFFRDLPDEPIQTVTDETGPGTTLTGTEMGRCFAYYASDDEDLTDQDETDEVSFQVWQDSDRDQSDYDRDVGY